MKTQGIKTRIFADGADFDAMLKLAANPAVKGFTTNPTLMRKAGIKDYRRFARQVLCEITDRPVSFEVLADDFAAMEAQALEITSWGANVNVKIPVTNTRGSFAGPLIKRLSAAGVSVNVTALTTLHQVQAVTECLAPSTPSFISVFAGRIADTGVDPVPIMVEALRIMAVRPNAELIWASPRELLNIFQADAIGCHVITVTADILDKLSLVGRNLDEYSLETVRMFHRDALAAGFLIPIGEPATAEPI